MRPLHLALLALSMVACQPTIMEIGDVDPGTDTDQGTDSDQDTETDPEISEFEGSYGGVIGLYAEFGGGGAQALCEAEMAATVGDDGTFSGAGSCPFRFGGGGGDSGYEIVVNGNVADDGTFVTTAVFTSQGQRIPELGDTELLGEGSQDALFGAGIVTVDFGFEFDAEVIMELQREP